MQLFLFVSRRLSSTTKQQEQKQSSAPLVRLSMLGVALSVCVMLVSVAVILGFKRQIGHFAYSQTGHISLWATGGAWHDPQYPLLLTPEMRTVLEHNPGVAELQPLIQQKAMLKDEEGFTGVVLYGLEAGYRNEYIASSITRGYMPSFSDRDSVEHPIVLPNRLAEVMGYDLGSKVRAYFLGERIQVRVYEVVGIYESSGIEQMPALCKASSLRHLMRWQEGMYNRLMLFLDERSDVGEILTRIERSFEENSEALRGQSLAYNSAEELLPDLFGWLELIDSNVYVLLTLMLIVASFTMITGLIIIVLDKRQQIGLLKALGTTDVQLRKIFALVAARLLVRSLLWGNLIALGLCLVQKYTKVIHLDPKNYMMDAVPIALDPLAWLGINVGALVLILLAVLLPTMIISRISPAEVMRME